MAYTPRQLEVLGLIREWLDQRGYAPTYAELGERLGVTAVCVLEHVQALIKKGALRREKFKARSLELVDWDFDRPRERAREREHAELLDQIGRDRAAIRDLEATLREVLVLLQMGQADAARTRCAVAMGV
jgi:SOS-response transcriptional repressor LexA